MILDAQEEKLVLSMCYALGVLMIQSGEIAERIARLQSRIEERERVREGLDDLAHKHRQSCPLCAEAPR
jgi:hypothetical protein